MRPLFGSRGPRCALCNTADGPGSETLADVGEEGGAMKRGDLPSYDGTDEFATRVECLEDTPGFFPVHSGRLPEAMVAPEPARVVIFGTDWGEQARARTCRRDWEAGRTCRCQRFRRGTGGEKPYPTEGNLFEVLTAARVDPKKVFLTNAALGLPKKQHGNAQMFGRHPTYLRECGRYHRRCLRDVEKPALAVLMGQPQLGVYGRSVWSVVWPELFGPGGVWARTRTLAEAFSSDPIATANGWRVQLMYHPASWTEPPDARWRTVKHLRRESGAVGAAL